MDAPPSSTSTNRRSTRDPSQLSPDRFERIAKEPGTKKLVFGQWVTVLPGDDDAIRNGPAQSSFGGE